MGKRGYGIVAGVLLSCGVAARATAGIAWEGGMIGGVVLAKLSGDTGVTESFSDSATTVTLDGNANDFRTGFSGGIFVGVRTSERFRVRLEFFYLQKGGKGTVNVAANGLPAGTATVTFKLDYLEFPLLAAWTIPAGSRTGVDLFGGPALAFKASTNLRTEVQGIADELDIGESVKGTDFGLAVGAGVRRALGRNALLLDGRYTFGLTDFPETSTGLHTRNHALMFTAGISVPLGHGTPD